MRSLGFNLIRLPAANSPHAAVGLAHLVQVLSGMLGTVIAFRMLPTTELGVVISAIAAVSLLCSPAIAATIKQYMSARVGSPTGDGARGFFWIYTVWSLVTVPLLLCYVYSAQLPISSFDLALLICAHFLGIQGIVIAELEINGGFSQLAWLRIVAAAFTLSCRVSAAFAGSIHLFVASVLVEQAALLIGALLILRAQRIKIVPYLFRPERSSTASLLWGTSKLAPTEYLSGAPFRLPLIWMGYLGLHREVAVFAAATRIAEAALAGLLSLFSVYRPRIYQEYAQNGPEFRLGARVTARYFLGVLFITIALVFASPAAVRILFGPEFAEGAAVAAVYGPFPMVVLLGAVQEPYLLAQHRYGVAFVRSCAGTAACVVLLAFLTPTFGMVGAAVATILSLAIQNVLSNLVWSDMRQIAWQQIKLAIGRSGNL